MKSFPRLLAAGSLKLAAGNEAEAEAELSEPEVESTRRTSSESPTRFFFFLLFSSSSSSFARLGQIFNYILYREQAGVPLEAQYLLRRSRGLNWRPCNHQTPTQSQTGRIEPSRASPGQVSIVPRGEEEGEKLATLAWPVIVLSFSSPLAVLLAQVCALSANQNEKQTSSGRARARRGPV